MTMDPSEHITRAMQLLDMAEAALKNQERDRAGDYAAMATAHFAAASSKPPEGDDSW